MIVEAKEREMNPITKIGNRVVLLRAQAVYLDWCMEGETPSSNTPKQVLALPGGITPKQAAVFRASYDIGGHPTHHGRKSKRYMRETRNFCGLVRRHHNRQLCREAISLRRKADALGKLAKYYVFRPGVLDSELVEA